jgi:hypothetical protein
MHGASPGSGVRRSRGASTPPWSRLSAVRRKPVSEHIKHSFTVAAEAFIAAKLEKERSGKVAERDLRSVFIEAWGERPVSEITKTDVLEIIITKKRTARRWPAHCWS